jgi:hypothetical protein
MIKAILIIGGLAAAAAVAAFGLPSFRQGSGRAHAKARRS